MHTKKKQRSPRKRRNPKDIVGSTKLQLHLIPPSAERAMARALACGAHKYGEYNWRDEAIEINQYVSALRRHLLDFMDGLDADLESKEHPLAHVMAGASVLYDAIYNGTAKDNRHKVKKHGNTPEPRDKK